MHLIQAHEGRVCALAYSPDGKLLASGGEDKRVRQVVPVTEEKPSS